ncbi:MAG: general secretion pathway protein G [Candidatus Frackibacter sp. T328-2]|nr:MAG: general secretion pathway protein G [Candidatus Frackibacter sp. T328-2]
MISKLRERICNVAKREEGFTLIELMIVIAVLGILAGIAIPRFSGVQDKAEVAAVKSELKSIQTGLEMYNAENGEYPGNLSDITSYVEIDGLNDYTSTTTAGGYSVTTSAGGVTVTLTPGGISESTN